MSESSGRVQEVSLGADLDALVHYGGTTVELHPGGDLVVKTKGKAAVYTNGDVDAYTDGDVHVHAAPKSDQKTIPTAPEIGDVMPAGHPHAGWIYMGPDE